MKRSTVRKLNTLNQQFYTKVAEDFNRTRQYYWQGWTNLLPYLDDLIVDKKQLRVLDLGCGNGRFGEFLAKTYPDPKIQYTGVDTSKKLLRYAQRRLIDETSSLTLRSYDIVEKLLTQKRLGVLKTNDFDLIIAFGVFHHIPSLRLRKKLLQILRKSLAKNGVLIATFWKFMNDERYKERVVKPQKIQLKSKDLERNDFIIDWKSVPEAFRYCHHFNSEEINTLTHKSGLGQLETFDGDGKSSKLNQYVILKKSKQA